jgi:ABC-2 type transport system ATP-binding protein
MHMAAPAIACTGLARRYGEVAAGAGVSFEVARGEPCALLGPNGAGKTTTVHILTTLTTPDAGSARVMGFEVVREAQDVRRSLGMVFQDPALDDRLTARENLEIHAVLYGIAKGDRRAKVAQALEWATLTDAADRRVRTLSGPMKRRVEFARALMHDPGVLFLDEPTLGLDPQGRRNLWNRIEALRQGGMTVMMTTHDLQQAASCDRVGIIDRGHRSPRFVGRGDAGGRRPRIGLPGAHRPCAARRRGDAAHVQGVNAPCASRWGR